MAEQTARPDESKDTLSALALGAAAGAVAAQLDFASTVLWLYSRSDQRWLFLVLTLVGMGVGALLGFVCSLVNRWIFFRQDVRSAHRRAVIASALSTSPIAWLLFSGGRMQRLPLLPLWRLGAAVVLTGTLATGLLVFRWFASRHPRAFAVVMIASAMGLHAIDHRVFSRLYQYLHTSLSIATWLAIYSAMAAIGLANQRSVVWLTRVGRLAPLLLVGGLWLLNQHENVLAEVFGTHAPFVRSFAMPLQSLAVRSRPARRLQSVSTVARPEDSDPMLPVFAQANLLLLTVDALRADVFDARHFPRVFAEFATRPAVRFRRVYTPAPHSSFAISSLHTGEYLHETVVNGAARVVPTLAQRLGALGYRTVGIFPPGIFFTQGEQRSWNSPLVRFWGIAQSPTVWLVDAQGKVLSTSLEAAELLPAVQKIVK